MNSPVTTPFSVSRSSRARARRSTSLSGCGWCPWSSLISSGWLEVTLVEIDVYQGVRFGRVAPEFAGVESHGVVRVQHPLATMCLDLRDRRGRVDAHDDPPATADIARAARVAGEVDVAHANGVAHDELGRVVRCHHVDAAGVDGDRVRQRPPFGAGVELVTGDRARLDEQGRDGREPAF